jgi:hypothetical protein
MNRLINADLIHLTLLQQEQILVEIEIAQIVNRRRRRRRPRRYWVRPLQHGLRGIFFFQTVADVLCSKSQLQMIK